MAKYVGQEHTMYLKICKKYNVQPEPEIKADGGKLVFNLHVLAFLMSFLKLRALCSSFLTNLSNRVN